MRTTLDLDEDVLASAKEIARRENKTAGQVLSELARRALTQGAGAPRAGIARDPLTLLSFLALANDRYGNERMGRHSPQAPRQM